MSRKEDRLYFRNLLVGSLAELVDPENIHNGRPANFNGALRVVCVYSAGTDHQVTAFSRSLRSHGITADIFVKYADEELNLTEADAEDILDDISDRVLDFIDTHQAAEGHWSQLTVDGRTETGDTVDVNGTEYRRETIRIYPS